MFSNKTFYPSTPALIAKMAAKIKGHPSRFLDPSAGKADLIEGILGKLRRRPDVAAIEIDPTLQATLRGKGINLIDSDFLNYSGPDQFDLIVANPPFDNGDAHLMKAISIMYSGQIIFLLNAETIRNPHTNQRRLLAKKLAELGAEIEFIQDAFLDAERKTGVEVALINIVIDKSTDSGLFDGCDDTASETDAEITTQYEVSTGRNIEELVAEFNDVLKVGTDTIIGFYRNHRKIGGYLSLSATDKKVESNALEGNGATSHMQNQINSLLVQLRSSFWRRTLDLGEVRKRLTEKKKKEFEHALVQQGFMDFTEGNIRQFVINLIGGYEHTLSDAVQEIFDKFTIDHSYRNGTLYNDNIHLFNGWKTNNAFRCGKKVIIPGKSWGRSFWNGFMNRWEVCHDTRGLLNDIDVVMANFDGMNDYVSIYTALDNAFHSSSRWDRQSGILSTFFKITVFKKGTVHLQFRDLDILRRFNVVACRGKNWLPDDYGARKYSKLTPEEAEVVDSFEGRASYDRGVNAIMFKSPATMIGFQQAA